MPKSKRNFVVYGLVCPIDNIVRYIGLSSNPAARKKAHPSEKGNPYKTRWIQKCLKETNELPEFKILKQGLTKKEACDLEIKLIKEHRDKYGDKLINLTDGGEGRLNYKHKEETKQKIGEAQVGEKNHMYGKKLTEERRKKVSRPVHQYDKEGNFINEYWSMTEAQKELDIDHTVIGRCCKGYQGTAGGFVWRYKDDPFDKYNLKDYTLAKEVIQLTIEGEEIARYKSISEAAVIVEVDASGICSCCKGYLTQTGGFKWRYA